MASKKRILIVDDNVDHGLTLKAMIESEARDIQYATNPLYALDLVRRWVPSIILLDIGLPDIDGYEAARRFRKALPDVRIYAITGYGTDADKARALAAGFDKHFTKPVKIAALESLL